MFRTSSTSPRLDLDSKHGSELLNNLDDKSQADIVVDIALSVATGAKGSEELLQLLLESRCDEVEEWE